MRRSALWRILDRDALKPWQSRSRRFPRGPRFAAKGGRDLYAGCWAGRPPHPDDGVLSADEKASIRARVRRQATTPPRPGQTARVEHEYDRGGALAYLAAWGVPRGGIMGRCEAKTGKAPFGRLGDQVMPRGPYRSAPRVCWVVGRGSSHRGATAAHELAARHPTLILVHLPTQASWLNQIESYFSIVQRKALTPDDFADLAAVEARLLACETLYNAMARPFDWRFTHADLLDRLAQLPDTPVSEAVIPAAA